MFFLNKLFLFELYLIDLIKIKVIDANSRFNFCLKILIITFILLFYQKALDHPLI